MVQASRLPRSAGIPPALAQAGQNAGPTDPLSYTDPRQLMKIRVVSGALSAVAMAPDVLDRWVTITDDTAADGTSAIRIVRKDRPQEYLRLVFQRDGSTPSGAAFDVEGIRGTLTFHAWSFNAPAHDSIFQSPDGLPVREVAAADLGRMFSAGL